MKRLAWVAIFAIATTAGTTGCDDGASGDASGTADAGPDCTEHAECGDTLVCIDGFCVLPQCRQDAECADGLSCEDFRCAASGSGAGGDGSGGGAGGGSGGGSGGGAAGGPGGGSAGGPGGGSGGGSGGDGPGPDADAGVDPPDEDASLVDPGPVDPVGEADAAIDPPDEGCDIDLDCDDGLVCELSRCIQPCFAEGRGCGDGQICDEETGHCVEPVMCPAECPDGTACDPLEGRCVAIPTNCPGGCADDQVCDEMAGRCVRAGCEDDALGGNDEPERAAPLGAGATDDLVLCMPDWFLLEVPEGEDGRSPGVRVTIAQDGPGNLDAAVWAEDGYPGAPLFEAQTDRDPEVLRIDSLAPGRYLMRIESWSIAPPAPVVPYRVEVEIQPDGFCRGDDACGGGDICEDDVCVDGGPCGRCPPLTACDADLGACRAACVGDLNAGANAARESAAQLREGLTEGWTICGAEEDWYRVAGVADETISVSAIGEAEGDVDIELWGPDGDAPVAQSAVADQAFEQIRYRLPADGTYFLRVTAAGDVSYRLDVAVGAFCLFDWDCCDAGEACGQRCDGVRGTCVALSCATEPPELECGGDEVCDMPTGRCVPAPCPDDQLVGNQSRESAVLVESGARIPGLTVCGGEEDWYRVDVAGAGDGIEAAIRFIDDGDQGRFDLELMDANGLLFSARSNSDDEVVRYNVDAPGPHWLRVFGAARGTYALEVDLVPGGIEAIACGPAESCGVRRVCDEGAGVCEVQTCAGPDANDVCPRGFGCDEQTGRCRCAEGDQFQETNRRPDSAAVLQPGAYADLTLCGGEEDWFRIAVPEGRSLVASIDTQAGLDPLQLVLLDGARMPLLDGLTAEGRIELTANDVPGGEAYIIVGQGEPPIGRTYTLTVSVE